MKRIDESYGKHFDEQGFWALIRRIAGPKLRLLIEAALQLWELLKSPDTPLWVKVAVIAALGYFVLTLDIVPDFIPGAGWADDLAVLVTTVGLVTNFITDEIKARAAKTTRELVGS